MRHTANRLFWVVFSLLLLCGPTKAKGEQSELVQKLSQTEGISDIQALPAGEFKEKYQFFIEQLIDPKHPETGRARANARTPVVIMLQRFTCFRLPVWDSCR